MTPDPRVVVQVRCSAGEKDRWKKAAQEAGLSLSDWIKVRLEPPRPSIGTRPGPPVQASRPVSQLFNRR